VFLQRIAVLGFAFKADTGDTRESAAITLIKDFQSEKAFVNVYDPQVEHEQIWADLQEASPLMPLANSTYRLFNVTSSPF
jgi:UDPglucose 6-dehydrogenase